VKVSIGDDFDLLKIEKSGQCFRVGHGAEGEFRFITGRNVLCIKGGGGEYEVSCGEEEWRDVWTPYFDLGRRYSDITERNWNDEYIDAAVAYGKGLRVLRQDPWEMLVTFIISQRKNIPAISKSVEMIAGRYGEPLEAGGQSVNAFPPAEVLARVSEEELRECSLGYRAPYVKSAAEMASSGELDLKALESADDETLFEELMRVRGVGKKVANCVCLFGYGRTARVPVDVWIARAIEESGNAELCSRYGDIGGIMQQYVFFYAKNKGSEQKGKQNE